MMHGPSRLALLAGARHQLTDANHQSYRQRCLLDTPSTQNQELFNAAMSQALLNIAHILWTIGTNILLGHQLIRFWRTI